MSICGGELKEILAGSRHVWHSADPVWMGPRPEGATPLDLPSGVVDLSPEDLVVTVRTGTPLIDLQRELGARGLRLGVGRTPFLQPGATVAEAIALSLPHGDEAQFGTWREWILGATIVLGDGTVAKSGSRAVKSVAGYDAHKLPVGARGALGIVVEVHLRLYAGRGEVEVPSEIPTDPWVVRVLPSEYERVEALCAPLFRDPSTATLWGSGEAPELPEPSWVLRPGRPPIREPERRFLLRAKALLDPAGKLNPGALL